MLGLRERVRLSRDEGSALVTVLMVMLVLTIGGLALSAIVVNTSGMVTDSRSTAQSRAAADAGLAQALAVALRDGEICDQGPIEVAPVNGTLDGGATYAVTRDCVSVEGRAIFSAVGRAPGGAITTTEAVYEYTPAPAVIKEPALITKAPLNLSALKIQAVDPDEPATVWVIPEPGVAGDFTCDSGGAIAGSVYLPAGTVRGVGGCVVAGDVYAEGDVTIDRGTKIGGDLVSLNGKVSISGGSTVGKGVYARNDITLSGGPKLHSDVVSVMGSVSVDGGITIDGSIHAKQNVVGTSTGANVVQSIYAGGNLTLTGGGPVARDRIMYGGAFSYSSGTAASWAVNSVTRTPLQPVVSVPQLPSAPEWQGITKADLDSLVSSGMFEKITWTGACAYDWYPEHEMVAKIKALTKPTLIDATHCAQVDMHKYSGTTSLKTDVIFVAPSFNIEDQDFESADGAAHRIWFIDPEVPGRTCDTVPPISIDGTNMNPGAGASKISAMIFTQCTVDFPNSGEGWKGSIQAGKMSGKPNFWYTPVGFPGSTAPGEDEDSESGTEAILGDLISRRDVASP